MRIAINTLSENPNSPSGSTDFLIQITREIVNLDKQNEYYIFVSKTNRHLFGTRSPNEHLVVAGYSNEKRLLRIFSEQIILPVLLRKYRIRVFFTSSGGSVAPLLAPKFTKLVVAVYGTQHFQKDLSIGFSRIVYRKCLGAYSLKRASKVISNSESCRKDIIKRFDIQDKTTIIYHGLDRSKFHDAELSEDERETFFKYGIKQPYILFLSTIWFYKNAHSLMKAFGRFIQQHSTQHALVLVGRIDHSGKSRRNYKEILLEIARHYSIEERVKFIGPIPHNEARIFYKMADIYVQPSFYETFGKTVVEAFACGCPVIASSTGATPEIVGDAGLLFDPHNIDELARVMAKVLQDEAVRQKLIDKGKERAKLFSIEQEVRGLISVFNEASSELKNQQGIR